MGIKIEERRKKIRNWIIGILIILGGPILVVLSILPTMPTMPWE